MIDLWLDKLCPDEGWRKYGMVGNDGIELVIMEQTVERRKGGGKRSRW